MQANKKQQQRVFRNSLYLKYSFILLLVSLSILVVACGPTADTTSGAASTTNPTPTATIRFNQNLSPIPTLPPYNCNAWVTTSTPQFIPNSQIAVYAKFTHLVDNNPVGVNGASATATLTWADNFTDNAQTTTTSDGLATFTFRMPNRQQIVNKNNLVAVSFTKPGESDCKVEGERSAFFTITQGGPQASPTNKANNP